MSGSGHSLYLDHSATDTDRLQLRCSCDALVGDWFSLSRQFWLVYVLEAAQTHYRDVGVMAS